MKRRRSTLEIYIDILKKISLGVSKPTNLMYKTNLSWLSLNKALKSLVSQGLIIVVEKDGRRFYKITEDGRRILEQLEKARKLLLA
ncbi:MAG: archaellum operon transcriptional activator EarA family protein [Candidatus Bathyarchaeia archaeon]